MRHLPSLQARWSPHMPSLFPMSGNMSALRGSKEWGERRKGDSLEQKVVSLTAACNYQTVTLSGSSDVTTLSPGLENRSIPCSHNLANGKTTTWVRHHQAGFSPPLTLQPPGRHPKNAKQQESLGSDPACLQFLRVPIEKT